MAELIEITLPVEEREGTVSVVGTWLKKVGDPVRKNQPVVEIETDKVNTEVAAPVSGRLESIAKREGEEVGPGEVLGRITPVAESGVMTAPAAAEPLPEAPRLPRRETKGNGDRARLLSPSVRRLFSQHALSPDQITGTGRGGRITYKDVCDFLATHKQEPATGTGASIPGVMSRRIPHNAMRRKIADHMVESLLEVAPHVTSVFEMDMSAVITHRKNNKDAFAAKGFNLTFTAYFVCASVAALKAVPRVNSRFHEDALEIFEDMNIGVGTALEDRGLIVPVIHRAQHHNLFGTATKLQDLTNRARQGKLEPRDLQGGTFTISNHGVGGSLLAAPVVINQPQSAILGVGKLQKRVVVIEQEHGDAMAIKPMCYVTLSIDHRALDAFQTNAFLAKFVSVIENWK